MYNQCKETTNDDQKNKTNSDSEAKTLNFETKKEDLDWSNFLEKQVCTRSTII